MSAIVVAEADPADPDALRLIGLSEAELAALYPPEARFAYSPEKLRESGTWFVIAWREGAALGCGGMQACPGYGELKRFYVVAEARGTGIAGAILDALEAEARRRGLPLMRLETGIHQHTAIRLYARRGYAHCPRFGDYPDNDSSVFMERAL